MRWRKNPDCLGMSWAPPPVTTFTLDRDGTLEQNVYAPPITVGTDWLDAFLGPDVTTPDPCTTARSRRVADRAVAASVRDVRDRGPAGVHMALGRLLEAGFRTAEIDADEAAKKAARKAARAARTGA